MLFGRACRQSPAQSAEHIKVKIKTRDIKAFFGAMIFTGVCLACICGIYLGCCRTYEEMRKTLFGDDRSAVIIGDEYIKFFDKEFYF